MGITSIEVESTEEIGGKSAGETAETVDLASQTSPRPSSSELVRPNETATQLRLPKDPLSNPEDFVLKFVQAANQMSEGLTVDSELCFSFESWRGGCLAAIHQRLETPSGLRDQGAATLILGFHCLLQNQSVVLEHFPAESQTYHRVLLIREGDTISWSGPYSCTQEVPCSKQTLKVKLPESKLTAERVAELCRERCPWTRITIAVEGAVLEKPDAAHIGRIFSPVSGSSSSQTCPHWVLLAQTETSPATIRVQKHGVVLREVEHPEYSGWTLYVSADELETDDAGLSFLTSRRLGALISESKKRLSSHFGSSESEAKAKDVWSYEPASLLLLCVLALGMLSHLLLAVFVFDFSTQLTNAVAMVVMAGIVEMGMSLRQERRVRPLPRWARRLLRGLAFLWAGYYLAQVGRPGGLLGWLETSLIFPAWIPLILDFVLNPDPPWD